MNNGCRIASDCYPRLSWIALNFLIAALMTGMPALAQSGGGQEPAPLAESRELLSEIADDYAEITGL